MRATLPFLRQKYDYFNELCFSGQLPQVRLRLSRARTYLGQLRYKRNRALWFRTTYSDITISLSTYLDLPEAEVEDTLLHEMIHLYILLSGQRDTSTHGALFRAKMREFNVKFGRHISVSHRTTEQERQQDQRMRRHLLCVCRLRNGKTGILLARPSNISRFWQQVPLLPDVDECRWYLSTSAYLNRYPHPRTCKIYSIPSEELAAILKEAHPLVREDGHIFVAKKR